MTVDLEAADQMATTWFANGSVETAQTIRALVAECRRLQLIEKWLPSANALHLKAEEERDEARRQLTVVEGFTESERVRRLLNQLAIAREALEEIGTFVAREALAKIDGREP